MPSMRRRCGQVLNLSDRPVLNEICDPSSPPRPRKCLRWWPPECIPLGDDTRTMSNYFHTLLLLLFWCCCGPSMAVNRGDGGRVLRQLLVLLMNQGRSLLSCLVSCEWPSPSSPNNTSWKVAMQSARLMLTWDGILAGSDKQRINHFFWEFLMVITVNWTCVRSLTFLRFRTEWTVCCSKENCLFNFTKKKLQGVLGQPRTSQHTNKEVYHNNYASMIQNQNPTTSCLLL